METPYYFKVFLLTKYMEKNNNYKLSAIDKIKKELEKNDRKKR